MAATDTEQSLRTYRGNCHCKAFVYEARLPEIKAAHQCNCSICHKKGYLWVMPQTVDHFKIIKGDENTLTSYTFNAKNRSHKVNEPYYPFSLFSKYLGSIGADCRVFVVLSDMCHASYGDG